MLEGGDSLPFHPLEVQRLQYTFHSHSEVKEMAFQVL